MNVTQPFLAMQQWRDFKKKLIHPQEFLNEINNFHNVELGDFQASEVDLVIHDWYNRQPHLIERFSLKTT